MKIKQNFVKELIGKNSVLVIEPSKNYKGSIRGFLTNLKISKVKFVNSTKEAKRELLTTKVGLFIVEWDLKDQNGIQFCRNIKRENRFKNVPFLLMTVENQRRDVVLASEVGIDGYLLKPFSFEDFSEALNTIARTSTKPNQVNQILVEAELALAAGEAQKASDLFSSAHSKNPNSARALCGLGKIQIALEDPKSAIEIFKEAIVVNPSYTEAYNNLCQIYQEKKMPKELYETSCELNNHSPGNPRYTLLIAVSAMELGRVTESQKFFKMTIRLSPKLADAYKGLGRLNIIQEDYQSAMKNFRKALDLDSQDASVLNSLGLVHVKQGQLEQGIDMYQAALKIKPEDSRILFNLGYAKEKTGDIESAKLFFKQALNSDPNFEKAKRRLKSIRKASAS